MPDDRARILIIEDDRAFLELLDETLTRRGHKIDCVTSTAAAGHHMRTIDYDLVLTDINMPGESGTEFCARLKQTRPDLPVLVMTAFGSLETAITALPESVIRAMCFRAHCVTNMCSAVAAETATAPPRAPWRGISQM